MTSLSGRATYMCRSEPQIVQCVMWTMASLGAVIVGLATVPSSMDFVPVHKAAFIFFVGCGLYAVVRTGLWRVLGLHLRSKEPIDSLCNFRHRGSLIFGGVGVAVTWSFCVLWTFSRNELIKTSKGVNPLYTAESFQGYQLQKLL